MGTNYYIKQKKCKTCGNTPDEIHLGKSSAGWQFTFQFNGGRYYKNMPEMKEWTKGKKIYDEYGKYVGHGTFWKMVKEKQEKEKLNHAIEMAKDYPERSCDIVIDGYSFTNAEFS
jgi:hypothetical protein